MIQNSRSIGLLTLLSGSLIALSILLAGCTNTTQDKPTETTNTATEKVELQIFAANSLSKAMEEAQTAYITDGHENISFADTQYKASGELNELLNAGSYADVLISASKGAMKTAVDKGHIVEAGLTDLFTNDLVMVANKNSELTNITLDDIAKGSYSICVGDESVPAGNYAAQALSTVGVYQPSGDDAGKTGKDITGKSGSWSDQYQIVLDTSVGNVCKHAESGDVDVAFVYSSDVLRFGGTKVVGEVPAGTHKPIVYPGGVCAQSTHQAEAQAFLEWCQTSPIAQEIWQKWGFELA